MRYTEEQKRSIVREYHDSQKVIDLCDQYNLSKSTLYSWIHQYGEVKADNGEVITAHRVHLLEKRIGRLTKELEIWRKCKCTIDSPLAQKLKAIENLYEEYGVHACCRVLEVRRSTFYHYLFRSPEQTIFEKEDETYKPIIKEVFDEAKGRIGAKKIRAIMMIQGYIISAERVSRLMREMELVCVSSKKKIKYNFTPRSNFRNNTLKRQFDAERPNSIWVSDITALYVNYKPYYLCAIIDLYSRKVISYSIANNQETPMVLDTFKDAYEKRRQPDGLMFHSDQGGQYASYQFRKYLRDRRVKQSFSNPGSPHDNAVAESFFRTLKAEEIYQHFYQTANALYNSVAEYIDFFNCKRPHQKFKYRTPNQVEAEYFKA
jgi:transposase InsO family protein/transposase-like protein